MTVIIINEKVVVYSDWDLSTRAFKLLPSNSICAVEINLHYNVLAAAILESQVAIIDTAKLQCNYWSHIQ